MIGGLVVVNTTAAADDEVEAAVAIAFDDDVNFGRVGSGTATSVVQLRHSSGGLRE